MKNQMAPVISLAVVLFAAVATVALREAIRRPEPQPVPGTEPAPVTVTVGESRPWTATRGYPGLFASSATEPSRYGAGRQLGCCMFMHRHPG
jgi:hypothetical protein